MMQLQSRTLSVNKATGRWRVEGCNQYDPEQFIATAIAMSL